MSTGKVLVVIPARNEAHTIGGVINKTRSLYPDYDIVVVDDASEDDTGTIARSQGALVLRTPIRLGYGGAVQTGFKYAASRDYEVVVLMDADGQHDPACIGDLVKATERFDLVIGSRFRGELLYKIPAVRLIGMKIFSWIVTNIVGHRITDTSSGFQAMRKDVFSLFASGAYPVDFPDADTVSYTHLTLPTKA